jgi:hypothetical protein
VMTHVCCFDVDKKYLLVKPGMDGIGSPTLTWPGDQVPSGGTA